MTDQKSHPIEWDTELNVPLYSRDLIKNLDLFVDGIKAGDQVFHPADVEFLVPSSDFVFPERQPELLTWLEKKVMDQTAKLWSELCFVVGGGTARKADLEELATHIHGIQRAVMAQAAARAYPDLYRPLGGDPLI